ncbi:MAG: hypothetical protein ABI811_03860 [Acidobacteriota bacterium]
MNQRYAVLFAVTCLTFAGCNKKDAGVIVDPALSTLVPGDTTLLVGIRAEDLMKTALYQKYLADKALGPLDDFARETGLDVRSQVWEVLLVSNGKESVVLGRGKFSNEAEPRLATEAKGAKRMSYKGFTMIGDERTAVLFISPTVAGVGDTAGLRRVVDARDQTNGPPAILATRMKDVPREAAIWSVYAGPPISLPPNAPANLGNLTKVLNSIESGSFYMDLRNAISGKATGYTASDQKAKELHDALRGLLGMAKLMGGKDDAKMQRIYDGLRVTQDARNVNLYVEEQEDAIVTLMNLFMNRPQAPVRPKSPPR